jgi:hypothetical protein
MPTVLAALQLSLTGVDWSALFAAVSAAVAAWAAWQAKRSAEAALKIARTANEIAQQQERLRIYSRTFDFLGCALQSIPPSPQEIHSFVFDTRLAKFQFDESVVDFIREIQRNANQWQEEYEQEAAGRLPLRREKRQENIKASKKALAKSLDDIDELFRPQLSTCLTP